MKRTLLALFAIAATTTMSASLASAQDIQVGPGPDHGYHGYRDRDPGLGLRDQGNCRIVISHHMGRNGSVTVRRRVCD